MKIKVKNITYDKLLSLPHSRHKLPHKPSIFFRTLLKTVGAGDLKATNFTYTTEGMEKLGPKQPALYLMNHSSFIDLKIASSLLYPRPFNIVCTSDGFVGKEWLMRQLGCIPTNKFVRDITLVRDMLYSTQKLKCSVLMYPEASYTFDGTATPLPASLGKCIKLLNVPVIMIKTNGAFARDPLYNNLQLRNVQVSANMKYLLSPEEIAAKSVNEINTLLKEAFTFDNFKWQQDNKVAINESFRADYLNRVLYKCPHCNTEGKMNGEGTQVTCLSCGKKWTLTEYGFMQSENGETEFPHIPDWYRWERECVRKEIEDGSYKMKLDVDVYALIDSKAIYRIGEGSLSHSKQGWELNACNGQLIFVQKPRDSYSLYSDYYWYELGDMICIGNSKILYYCFPKNSGDFVAKARLATEELYALSDSPATAG